MSTSFAPRPLEGILVLDLSRILAGPFASMMLGDMGAIVIKVEEPERGDDTRDFGPPFWEDESAYFLSVNRSKRSVAVDLKKPEGVALIERLAAKADVVLENFRPGTAETLGLGYEKLSAANPGLIYVSISGFGQTGPDRNRPGYDVVAQGMSGIMSLTGPADGEPYKVGISQADLIAGLYAVQGTLLALLSRQRTGKGQHVDVALLDGQVSLLTFAACGYFASGREPARMGNQHASIAPYETYAAADGHFVLAAGNDGLWQKLCKVLGQDELASDERFATNRDRVSNRADLNEILMPLFQEKTVAEWVSLLDKAGVPAGPIHSVPEALAHPQVLARDMVIEMQHPTVGTLKTVGNPIKLSATPPGYDMPPPLLGEHTIEVLRAFLDMNEKDIDSLLEQGVVRQYHAVASSNGATSKDSSAETKPDSAAGEAAAASAETSAATETGADEADEAAAGVDK